MIVPGAFGRIPVNVTCPLALDLHTVTHDLELLSSIPSCRTYRPDLAALIQVTTGELHHRSRIGHPRDRLPHLFVAALHRQPKHATPRAGLRNVNRASRSSQAVLIKTRRPSIGRTKGEVSSKNVTAPPLRSTDPACPRPGGLGAIANHQTLQAGQPSADAAKARHGRQGQDRPGCTVPAQALQQ